MLSVCSIPSFEEVKGIVRISFPYLERSLVSSCRPRVNGALFFFDILEGPVRLFLGWSSLLSHEVGGSSQSLL